MDFRSLSFRIMLVAFLIPHNLHAKFSLKKMVSYVIPKTQEQIVSYDHSFAPDGSLTIENTHGDITIKTWNQETIVVEVLKKGPEKEIEQVKIDSSLTKEVAQFRTRQPEDSKVLVSYTVMLPKKARAKIYTEEGSILVHPTDGIIDAKTDEGSIKLMDAGKKVNAQVGSGDITIKTHSTVPLITAECDEGSITLDVPRATDAHILAKASKGGIESDLYVTLKSRTTKINSQYWNMLKREIDGTVGQGTGTIKLTMNEGPIKIMERR